MCFNISLARPGEDVSDRFDAVFDREIVFDPIYHSSAFDIPRHPVICMDEPGRLKWLSWGLIPRWIGNDTEAKNIRFRTLNARSETIFEKPSFKQAIMENRCLIPVTGFFEFREVNGRKYPYHIRPFDGRILSLAGIFEDWRNGSGKDIRTFSIVTVKANPLMSRIHNTKMRMPVILKIEEESIWMNRGSSRDDLVSIMKPYPDDDLEAFPVSKALTKREVETDLPFIIEPFDYPELRFKELESFG